MTHSKCIFFVNSYKLTTTQINSYLTYVVKSPSFTIFVTMILPLRSLVLTCSLFLLTVVLAQNNLSNSSRIALADKDYALVNTTGETHALVFVNELATDSIFKANGIFVNGKFGQVWSISFDSNLFNKVQSLPCIAYIELANKATAARYKNDLERQATSVDKVQNGLQNSLPLNYTGKGVIVGIVDIGFQGNNPTFFNAAGNKNRIIKWWQQSNKNGTPPTGYSYGTEFTDSTTIINGNDMDGAHGTHVAGIAAGSGLTTPNLQYRGMAPEAEFVLVSIKYSNDTLGGSALGDYVVANPTIIDAYKYIFDYAQSVGKPAVINLSWGMHTGPHDGSSLFDKATDALVGKGKVLVGANGNEGDNNMHWNYSFANDTASTIVIENYREGRNRESVYTDFWGSANTNFAMQIQILDTNKKLITQTPFISSASDKVNTFNLNADTSQFKIVMVCQQKNILNNKPNITLMADQFKPKKYIIVVKMTSLNSEVHGWNTGAVREWTSGSFRNKVGKLDFSATFIDGNTNSTNGENGGTSKSVISVGAMAARSAYKNVKGVAMNDTPYVFPGRITRFSSKGPTIDGRIKPDISAPGFDVPSSVNNKQFEPWMIDRTLLKSVFRNDTNYWTAFNGTSMASPHVCGIVALILQANPNLTANDIKTILHLTATQNSATGTLPNNQYGYGIVNAYEAVKMALQFANVNTLNKGQSVTIYPNPASNELNIKMLNNGLSCNYKIINAMGQLVKSGIANATLNQVANINIDDIRHGFYILEIAAGGEFYAFKFEKN